MPSLLKARHAGRRTHTGARNMMLRAELSLTKCTHKAGYKGGPGSPGVILELVVLLPVVALLPGPSTLAVIPIWMSLLLSLA